MDYANKSIPAERVTSFDVNKAIQRSLTKAVARHGLGLYIYAGEDLPEASNSTSDNFKTVLAEVSAAKDENALRDVYYKYQKDYNNNKEFINAVNARKEQLKDA
jgi:hypothetical protein